MQTYVYNCSSCNVSSEDTRLYMGKWDQSSIGCAACLIKFYHSRPMSRKLKDFISDFEPLITEYIGRPIYNWHFWNGDSKYSDLLDHWKKKKETNVEILEYLSPNPFNVNYSPTKQGV